MSIVESDGFILKDTKAGHLGISDVHLTSGEDIIGDVYKDRDLYTIKKPVIPNVAFDQGNSKFHVGLLPLRPYLGTIEQIEVPSAKVIYVVPVGKQMEQLYRQFTSDIILAPSLPPELPVISPR
jgi:hypothetical protein